MKKHKRFTIIHTVASLEKSTGGPARTVTALCEGLGRLEIKVGLVTQKVFTGHDQDVIPLSELVQTTFVQAVAIPRLRVTFAPGYKAALKRQCRLLGAKLIHSHGLWLPSNHAATSVARCLDIPLIVSPRGMIEPWAMRYGAWKKKLVWLAYQKNDLMCAHVLHATSVTEMDNLRALGFRQPVALVPNGVDAPVCGTRPKRTGDEPRTVLFLSRLHPVKGLLNLVRAWHQIRPEGWRVVIAGPDENNHRAEVEAAIHDLGLSEIFSFAGPIDDSEKWDYFLSADVFVLPSFTENFGVVVAEALASGIPVVATKGSPWAEFVTYGCGWWVDIGVEPLAAALCEAVSLSDTERNTMGLRGRKLVEERYGWPGIAADMRTVYEWVLGGGAKPACVITD
ncbi:MAG: glycosyltransferase [Methylococcales bacterium]